MEGGHDQQGQRLMGMAGMPGAARCSCGSKKDCKSRQKQPQEGKTCHTPSRLRAIGNVLPGTYMRVITMFMHI